MKNMSQKNWGSTSAARPFDNARSINRRRNKKRKFAERSSLSQQAKVGRKAFDCKGLDSGEYVADVTTNCKKFHVCWAGRSASFLCPAGTAFSQRLLVCDWEDNVYC